MEEEEKRGSRKIAGSIYTLILGTDSDCAGAAKHADRVLISEEGFRMKELLPWTAAPAQVP